MATLCSRYAWRQPGEEEGGARGGESGAACRDRTREQEEPRAARAHQVLHGGGQHGVERAQPDDREDIGREGDERIARHAKDGRDRVDGKEDVGELDADEHDEQRRRAPEPGEQPAALGLHVTHPAAGEEPAAVEIARRVERVGRPLDDGVVGEVIVVVAVPAGREQLVRGEDEEGAEDHDERVELVDQDKTAADEEAAQDRRAWRSGEPSAGERGAVEAHGGDAAARGGGRVSLRRRMLAPRAGRRPRGPGAHRRCRA